MTTMPALSILENIYFGLLVVAQQFNSIFMSQNLKISGLPKLFPNGTSTPPWLDPNTTNGIWDHYKNFSGCHFGERYDGLSKLKNYFNHFGYINSDSTNFTDYFDDSLESAIKTYQANFNLNTTGWLDEVTIAQIVQPRCGVADIINGSSSMNSGKKMSQFHTVGHFSFFPDEPRWAKTSLTYAFLPGNELSDTAKAVFSRAFDRWATVIPMSFSEISSYSKADIKIGFFRGDHGDGEAFDGVLGTLAHAFSPPSGIFHLDGDEDWVVNDITLTSHSSSAVDMESVAVHEIGHLLGLGHSSVDGAIMFPTISTGTRRVNLESDDIQGVQQLYGSNPNYNGSATAAMARENETNDGQTYVLSSLWDLKLLLTVVLVFFSL